MLFKSGPSILIRLSWKRRAYECGGYEYNNKYSCGCKREKNINNEVNFRDFVLNNQHESRGRQ
uniref:Uncharacterized protein n=1 Tax=Daucus carota subsp. sativus TaxID=79200 RepID=A0A166FRF6_DAUCS